MTQERWDRIRELFTKALELPLSGQNAFLGNECREDSDLIHELQFLLAESSAEDSAIRELIRRELADLAESLRGGGKDLRG